MPQTFIALQCAFCNTYQVQQDKMSKRFACAVCSKKQSFRQILAISTSAKDIRKTVQELNELRGEADRACGEVRLQDTAVLLPKAASAAQPGVSWSEFADAADATGADTLDTSGPDGFFVTALPDAKRPCCGSSSHRSDKYRLKHGKHDDADVADRSQRQDGQQAQHTNNTAPQRQPWRGKQQVLQQHTGSVHQDGGRARCSSTKQPQVQHSAAYRGPARLPANLQIALHGSHSIGGLGSGQPTASNFSTSSQQPLWSSVKASARMHGQTQEQHWQQQTQERWQQQQPATAGLHEGLLQQQQQYQQHRPPLVQTHHTGNVPQEQPNNKGQLPGQAPAPGWVTKQQAGLQLHRSAPLAQQQQQQQQQQEAAQNRMPASNSAWSEFLDAEDTGACSSDDDGVHEQGFYCLKQHLKATYPSGPECTVSHMS